MGGLISMYLLKFSTDGGATLVRVIHPAVVSGLQNGSHPSRTQATVRHKSVSSNLPKPLVELNGIEPSTS